VDVMMSQRRILLTAIAIGFVSGFTVVAAANGGAFRTKADYSAAG
jgi:hypothetical protein